jgi:hypothetical protein
VSSIWDNFSPDNVFKLGAKPVDVKSIGERVFCSVDKSDWKSDFIQWKNFGGVAEHEARLIFCHVNEVSFFIEKTKMNKTLD